MLKFEPARIMSLRNIEKPFTYLRSQGFTHSTSYNILRGTITTIKLSHILKLCHLLHCTPNDLFTYTPEANAPAPEADTLTPLIRTPVTTTPLSTIFQSLPLDRLEAIRKELNDHIDPSDPPSDPSSRP